eukprot:1884459-Pleurochrysis_carterae.AAC.1
MHVCPNTPSGDVQCCVAPAAAQDRRQEEDEHVCGLDAQQPRYAQQPHRQGKPNIKVAHSQGTAVAGDSDSKPTACIFFSLIQATCAISDSLLVHSLSHGTHSTADGRGMSPCPHPPRTHVDAQTGSHLHALTLHPPHTLRHTSRLPTGLGHVKDSKIGSDQVRGISGGQRRRVTLARGIASGANILFCDEPTSGLSSTDAEICIRQLKARHFARTFDDFQYIGESEHRCFFLGNRQPRASSLPLAFFYFITAA